ncbi:MAG: adenine deaminase [bacterium]|nr:adenine deaminase [bacterium]
MDLEGLIEVAAGRRPADLLLAGGRVVNVLSNEIYPADVAIAGGRIAGLGKYEAKEVVDLQGQIICPGFIDAHVHIESSMLSVPEYAAAVVSRGTTAVITDPHELANVLGAEGIRFMLSSSKYCPIHVYVMLSSCVPASHLESSGAELTAVDLLPMLSDQWVLGLAEVMNYPGVISNEPEVVDKIRIAMGGNIDGHAPGLTGRDLVAYAASGVQTDHECTNVEEAREKLRLGLAVMIREGSPARNLDALLTLVTPATASRFMFCTDDKDVDDLLEEGHIDCMVRRAIAAGVDPPLAIRLASYNAARHYGLHQVGAVCPGYHAVLTVLDDFENCRVTRVYQGGDLVAQDGVCLYQAPADKRRPILRSTINVPWLEVENFRLPCDDSQPRVHVIEMIEDQISTNRSVETMPVEDGAVQPDPSRDLAKIAVIERHLASGNIGLGFVRGLGLTRGAIASSVAHDAHNLIVAGTNDADIYAAAVQLVRIRGGYCVVADGKVLADCPLPIAGLMSDRPADELRQQLRVVRAAAAGLGCQLRRPFMALSFLSLSVIGSLKVTDQGLIDVDRFERVSILADE